MAYLGQPPTDTTLSTFNETFSGDSGTTVFTLSRNVGRASDLEVFIGSTQQLPVANYTASGTTLTFSTAPTTGTNNITVIYRGGALLTVNPLDGNFGQGTEGAPTVNSSVATTTGLYWPSTTTVAVSTNGTKKVTFGDPGTSTSTTTGALQVTGGSGITGNLNVGGYVKTTSTTAATSASTGALIVAGGAGIAGNAYVDGNLVVAGTVIVTGNINTQTVDYLKVSDPLIFVGDGNASDIVDEGIYGTYNDGTQRYWGVFRDATDGNVKVFSNLTAQPTSTINTAGTGYTLGNFYASTVVAGNVTTSANTISTTNTNGNLVIDPNGTGTVNFTATVVPSANVTYDLGTTSLRWTNIYGVATSALYADLAENYVSDAVYEAGTVVSFGGDYEITKSIIENDKRVAGVISSKPAYLMNSDQVGKHILSVALVGRVPTKVIGKVSKGDLMVSAGNGYARAEENPAVGTVIGKALQDSVSLENIIEVVVGRI